MYRYILGTFLLIQILFKWAGCSKQFKPVFWHLDNFVFFAPHFTYFLAQDSLKASLNLNPTKTTYSIYFLFTSLSLF